MLFCFWVHLGSSCRLLVQKWRFWSFNKWPFAVAVHPKIWTKGVNAVDWPFIRSVLILMINTVSQSPDQKWLEETIFTLTQCCQTDSCYRSLDRTVLYEVEIENFDKPEGQNRLTFQYFRLKSPRKLNQINSSTPLMISVF